MKVSYDLGGIPIFLSHARLLLMKELLEYKK